jgi:DNA invertase Pin-like site-specific DNA recombinase
MHYVTPADLLAKYGSKSAIARAYGVSRPTVYVWFRAGKVPEIVQYKENVTLPWQGFDVDLQAGVK